ncbi:MULTISPECIES: oxidoreductase [Pseudomonadati]|uniref:SDR family oxidoreductase n=1 Tax=Shewanella aestuarii TaxID=1028752 RepID=A0ABT0L205_9GAMM|nr:oxidoreductase [Shewanella aestuarii]MCL1117738.1 SDR family oxidoreductase [Shewanella aestuarii]GGN76757.1 SDR family oxidoreductase [Shewanella aestuarii]
MHSNNRFLVLGAGGLLGKTVVEALLANKAEVIATDINTDTLLAHFGLDNDQLSIEHLDVNNEVEVVSFFQNLEPIDGVVNCSYPRNKDYGKKLFDVSLASFNDNISLHLGAAFLIMQQSAALFLRQNAPLSIVNVSSIYGVVAPKFEIYDDTNMTMPVEYAAIKSAIVHLNKYFASYIHDSRFRVNSISPGGLFDAQPDAFLDKYKQLTMGAGMLNATDMTGSILFLLSEQSKYITGQNLIIDDGFSL